MSDICCRLFVVSVQGVVDGQEVVRAAFEEFVVDVVQRWVNRSYRPMQTGITDVVKPEKALPVRSSSDAAYLFFHGGGYPAHKSEYPWSNRRFQIAKEARFTTTEKWFDAPESV